MFPIAKDAEPLELFALNIDELSRKRFTSFSDFQRRKLARFFNDFVFDRESMTIPPRHEWRAFTEHGLRFHDEILEDLVERSAHMDIAIGKRRSVMQNE